MENNLKKIKIKQKIKDDLKKIKLRRPQKKILS